MKGLMMPTQVNATILQLLKNEGPRSETEIAAALKMPVARVRDHVVQLSSSGDIVCCSLTRFEGGKKIEGLSCRLSCYTPPAARGRKPGVKPKAGAEKFAE
jgi:predicted transcriptional regulator